MEEKGKRGYLEEDFRLFHIKDQKSLDIEYHYHDFDKIVILLAGEVTYIMEGKSYFLKPWDILLVGHNQIHRPIIGDTEAYERIVLWMNTKYLTANNYGDDDLLHCFTLAKSRNFSLLRLEAPDRHTIRKLLSETENAINAHSFGHELLARLYFLQFMVELNHIAMRDTTGSDTSAYRSDPKFNEIIAYVNNNLTADLSLDALSARFYISKSYLMHKFKEMAGCSAHSYIQQKRLIHAAELIRDGTPVLIAASESGFNDYSAFLRAFKRLFGSTPRELS